MSNCVAELSPEENDLDKEADRISELPDDIAFTFLSNLGIKEAAKTSILSKRWRYLWTYWTDLDFDYSEIVPECVPQLPELWCTSIHKIKYMNWVNQVVRLHRGLYIDKFKVRFYFQRSDVHHIDRWVEFALSKRVKNLELDLLSFGRSEIVYTLGFDMLQSSLCGISLLTSLHLRNVDVSGELIELLLSECHLLKRLLVQRSAILVRLKVISCNINYLTIRSCPNLKEFEIHAVNLIFFEYFDIACLPVNIEFKCVASLVEAAFGGECCFASVPIFQQIACFSMQLSRLSLDLEEVGYAIPRAILPTFCNVKLLEVAVGCDTRFDLPAVTRLIAACPLLGEFKLEVTWFEDGLHPEAFELRGMDFCRDSMDMIADDVGVEYELGAEQYSDTEAQMELKAHPFLRLFELVGFNGCSADVELLLYIVDLASNLETIICNPHRCPFECTPAHIIEASRSRASKLAKIIAPEVNVVIT